MDIFWSSTPNPDAVRFELPVELPISMALPFDRQTPAPPPLVMRLLGLEGVSDCLVASRYVTVKRNAAGPSWSMLRPEIVAALLDSLSFQQERAAWPNWSGSAEGTAEVQDASEAEMQIRQLLRDRIAPAVARDGGDIALVSFVDGTVTVRMSGACGGCPSAMMTLRQGVETTLQRYVPEVRRVVAERAEAAEKSEPFWKTMLRKGGARFRGDHSVT